jgi:hypothetical protein
MCVIIYTKINGKQYLIKNRDRTYNPNIEVIHEIINGIEIVYIYDLITGWREGMNELGIGLVNSSLSSSDDINKSIFERVKKNPNYLKTRQGKRKLKGESNYEILIDPKFKNKIANCIQHDICYGITSGHTLLVIENNIYHIEKYNNNKERDFFLIKLNKDKNIVLTNHGIHGNGGLKGHSAVSSFLRKDIIEYEMKHNKIHSINDLLEIINTNYTNIDIRFHPYRDGCMSKKLVKSKNFKKTKYVSTTGQLVMNMTDKIFNYFFDSNHSISVKYVNNLPKNYHQKIQVNIHSNKKNMFRKKRVFSNSYLQKIYRKFKYKNKIKNKTKHNKDKIIYNRTKNKRNKTNFFSKKNHKFTRKNY